MYLFGNEREILCRITGLSYNSIDFLFNRKLSDIEIETLLGECENIHADVACSGGYEEMRKIIKEKSELDIGGTNIKEGDFYGDICYFRHTWSI